MPHSKVTNIPYPMDASQLRRRRALADALAGVAASLISLWTFYPMDVWKTKLQAGLDTGGGPSHFFRGLFRGLGWKTLHAASSSFTYFYLYSFIVSWWTSNNNNNKNISPAVRLSLSAIAAMINTLLTLPLDVVSSQEQAAAKWNDRPPSPEHSIVFDETTQGEEDESESDAGPLQQSALLAQQQQILMDRIWKSLQTDPKEIPDGELFYESCSEERPTNDSNCNEEKEERGVDSPICFSNEHTLTVTVTTTASTTIDPNQKLIHMEPMTNMASGISIRAQNSRLSRLASLWKGLYPSLLLCSNPSIHYTVFDLAKSHLLQSRPPHANHNLSLAEAFWLGLLAKFCATIATYPLIRAKVMLMVVVTPKHKGLLRMLAESYRRDGLVRGWYKGCGMQLLHTVLKSALLMMVNERIAVTTHRLLLPQPPKPN